MEKTLVLKIFTSDDVMNIQYGIGKVFGSRERAYSMGVNDFLVPDRPIYHMQNLTMDLEI